MELWQTIFWAILTVALISTEIATVQLVAIWFGAGALVAFVASFFGMAFWLQIVIFILISVILLLLTRPTVKKWINGKKIATNADSIIGMTGIVIEKIDNIRDTGRVMVNGLNWSARAANEKDLFDIDSRCEVISIEGVKAIVKPFENN